MFVGVDHKMKESRRFISGEGVLCEHGDLRADVIRPPSKRQDPWQCWTNVEHAKLCRASVG